ncbi:MAG: hypothetical protein AAFV25_16425 [Bacteroidota bacterium]
MKKIYFFVFTALIGMAALVSCQKENITTNEAVQFEGFALIDGRLAFDDEASYKDVLNQLYLAQDELDKWEKAVPSYTSMRTQFESFTDENAEKILENFEEYKYLLAKISEPNGDYSIERNIYNDVISTLVSNDGFLQIGTTVYRFTHDHFYSVDVEDIDLLKTANIDLSNPAVTRTTIKRDFMISDTNVATQRAQTVGECTNEANGRRTRGQILRETLFDNDCIMRTKHQRRRLGVWWSNRTTISVNYSGNFVKIWSNCSPTPRVFFSDGGFDANASSISRVVPGNHPSFNGCNGSATPFHDGLYRSTHRANGRTCTLRCPPLSSCFGS